MDRPSPEAVERALKLQEGSVLAREVLALDEKVKQLRKECQYAKEDCRRRGIPPAVLVGLQRAVQLLDNGGR